MKTTLTILDPLSYGVTADAGKRIGTPLISGLVKSGSAINFTADRPGTMNYMIQAANLIAPALNDVALLINSAAFTLGSTNSITLTGLTPGTSYVLYYTVEDSLGNNATTVMQMFGFVD